MSQVPVAPPIADDQRVVLHGIRWSTLEALLADLGRQRVRFVYEDGTLELMTTSRQHERIKKVLARMLEALTDELDVSMVGWGSSTLKRKRLRRAVEPDECFSIGHPPGDITLRTNPDLAIEVDISRSSVRRLAVYAKLGVTEVWRWDGSRVLVHRLDGDRYVEAGASAVFPRLPMAELSRFVARWTENDDTRLLRSFREWLREQLSSTGGPGGWTLPGRDRDRPVKPRRRGGVGPR